MKQLKISMTKDKTTKGAYRFAGEYNGSPISLYFRKTDIPSDVEEINVVVSSK